MRQIIKNIPNLITLLNLLCGAIAIKHYHDVAISSIFILTACLFDFFDGLVARLLKVSSNIGKELDSLADVVSFGLAPSFIVYDLLADSNIGLWAYLSFLIVACSAYRLAKFNVDTRQTKSFLGLPTPASAIFWIGLVSGYGNFFVENHILLILIILLISYLLVCELPMFSFKLGNSNRYTKNIRIIMVVASAVLMVSLLIKSLMWIIVLYIILSVIDFVINKTKKNRIQT